MKKFKSILTATLIIILTVAMMMGSMSLVAFGATAGDLSTNSIKVVEKVEYGKEVIIDQYTLATVTAPNGTEVDLTQIDNGDTAKFAATQLGMYSVKYSAGNDYYDSFKINCYLKDELILKVDNNGAGIPTYWQENTKFTLPSAKIVSYNEDGEETIHNANDVKVKIGDGEALDASKEQEYTPSNNGVVYIQYFYKNGDSNYLTKDYSVKVQKTFIDTEAPTLTVVNVPRDADLNKKVSLPVATATDNFDERVKISVKVLFGLDSVKVATVDKETGFATGIATDAKVVSFDNDKNMYFYPTVTGDYKVIYQAIDSKDNKTVEYEFFITCADKAAPEYKEIADEKIPTKWGLNVKTVNSNKDEINLPSTDISFPTPKIIDNSGNTDKLKVSFKIIDPKNNTVVNFANILSSDIKDRTYTNTATAGGYPTVVFSENLNGDFAFNFNKYSVDSKIGDYTVEYKAKDERDNTLTKTYKISLQQVFTDKAVPTTELTVPKYLLKDDITPTEFVIPTPIVSDDNDTRLTMDYTVAGEKIKGGETLILGSGNLKIKDGNTEKEIENSSALTSIDFKVSVTDDVGLKAELTKSVAIKGKSVAVADYTLNTAGIKVKNADNSNFLNKQTVKLGGFEITGVKDADINYTGFEVVIREPDEKDKTKGTGKIFNQFTLETLTKRATDNNTIIVRGIEFIPSIGGTYSITVRVFDVSGNNKISTTEFLVEGSSNDGSASNTLPTTVEINKSYSLTAEYPYTDEMVSPNGYAMVRKITGANYTLMASEFTAKTSGTYKFEDTAVEKTGNYDQGNLPLAKYWTAASDTIAPTIEVQGIMPLYSAKDVEVNLPSVVGISKNGIAEVKIEVKDKDNVESETTKLANGGYSFIPTLDGKYTVNYTATLNAKTDVRTFTINVGDVVAPTFTNPAPVERVTSGYKFDFAIIEVTADSGESTADYTYTKKLIAPDNTSVASISGTGETYRKKINEGTQYKLDKSGTYQVIYEVTDKVGNMSTQKYTITVNAKTTSTPTSLTAISTVLIVVGVLLIVGLFIYFIRFRKVKEDKRK